MIKVDFYLAITIFTLIPCILVFIPWVFYTSPSNEKVEDHAENLQQCPYCTYIFFDYYQQDQIAVCPRCHSFISTHENPPERRKEVA